MTGDHRQRLLRVFMEMVVLPAAARAEALEGLCGPDSALRAKVEALLAADSNAAGLRRACPQCPRNRWWTTHP